MNPTVSVIIPCFDQAQYLEDAVQSLERQTRKPDVVVVIDDGSAIPVSVRSTDLPMRIIRQENMGLAAARNRGFEEVTTSYVVPLDADDMLMDTFIERTLRCAQQTEAPFVYTDIETFGTEARVYRHPPYDLNLLMRDNFIVATAMIRKDVWDAVKISNGYGYDPGLSILGGYEDYMFYIEAGLLGLYGVRVPEVLFKYRRRHGSMLSVARANHHALRYYMSETVLRRYGHRMPLS